MARWTFAGSLGVMAGPIALSAAAILGLGWRGLFLLFAGLMLISLAVAYRFRFADGQRESAKTGFDAGVVEALRTLWRGEVLRWLTLLECSDLMVTMWLLLLGPMALLVGIPKNEGHPLSGGVGQRAERG